MKDEKEGQFHVGMVDLNKLQAWQDNMEKRQAQFQENWDRWVKTANDNVQHTRRELAENRKIQRDHIKVVEGYLKALNKLIAKK